ncbi:MAG: carboxyl transferase domain-containing protein [Candidatus Hydrogenedentota bacterium]
MNSRATTDFGSEKLLIANRGEIAVRIARAAAELGMPSVAVYSEDDAECLHTKVADESVGLTGSGAAAYLDAEQIVATAKSLNCTLIHPGYGFLSENARFACMCGEEGIAFVGPTAEMLEFFGDKGKARGFATACEVPLLAGISGAVTVEEARDFFASFGDDECMMIKAVGGGGGRGMRVVRDLSEVDTSFAHSTSEALASCGNGDVFVERFLPNARHVEIQVIGDGQGDVSHVWDRDCSIQRRHQKVIEVAPSPNLHVGLRDRIIDAALKMADKVGYRSLGTFEFLVDATTARNEDGMFAFIEVNPRLQVEHTVTEAVTGVDLVAAQLKIACGATLKEVGLDQESVPEPDGFAIQARINMETLSADGTVRPSMGTLSVFEPPSGDGFRADTLGYAGYKVSARFDSLLAKLIGRGETFADVSGRMCAGVNDFAIEGVATNIPLLSKILAHPDFVDYRVDTEFLEDHIGEFVESKLTAGADVDSVDPLAVLAHGKSDEKKAAAKSAGIDAADEPGMYSVRSPMQGTVVEINIAEGDSVHRGQQLLVLEAMKMQHLVTAEKSGIVRRVTVGLDDTIYEDHPLVVIEDAHVDAGDDGVEEEIDLDHIRPDLQEVIDRHRLGLDESRPEAVAKRTKTGHRTARINLAELVDEGTYVEYGALAIAAQRARRDVDDLIRNTPADGMIAGLGSINGALFDDDASRCAVVSYDYMVLAGTQGKQGHKKKDRIFEVARDWMLPIVLFAEGGGGRPGDTDGKGVAGLNCLAFTYFAKLSGLVPMIGITTGRCFAGNAVLLGCCDVIIATKDSNIGVGGPAMIEGGGLGVFRPEEVGPMDVQVPNGVVDIAVEDEAEAVQVAKKYLSYFQGSLDEWECADQRLLRPIIPENRLRVYDIREVIEIIADTDSVLELRRQFGHGIVTSFIRIEGRPVGVIANNPVHLAGAIDRDGSDKGARFMQLCDAFDIPILSLCDCPGIMVGPESEETALVRHASRMFVVGANVTVPMVTVVVRKAYGLGAQAMAGGGFHTPIYTISWPTGEFGGMGLEGAVKLGFRKELEAVEDPHERKELYEQMVAQAYENGKATNTASHFEVDAVIDPKDTRHWIMTAFKSVPTPPKRTGKKRPFVDTW